MTRMQTNRRFDNPKNDSKKSRFNKIILRSMKESDEKLNDGRLQLLYELQVRRLKLEAQNRELSTPDKSASGGEMEENKVESPGITLSERCDTDRVRNYSTIMQLLISLGLRCCGKDVKATETKVKGGLRE